MIGPDEALELLVDGTEPLEPVAVDLERALGRALAAPVRADRDFPPTDRSAMDGFAVRSADAVPGGVLAISGELPAGAAVGARTVGPGAAVRVFTGSVVPPGADAVVRVEDVDEDAAAGRVRLATGVAPGENVRRRGGDVRAGEVVLAAGAPLRAADLAALASVGCVRPRVHPAPRLWVLSTGDELVDPAEAPADHQIRDSNAPALAACLADIGIAPAAVERVHDDPAALAARVEAALGAADVLLVTGGVSVGAHDHVERVVREAGVSILFHGVGIKPGKPILAGRRGGATVLGLPGNPVSAFAGFVLFAAPLLRRLGGFGAWRVPERTAVLEAPLVGRPGRVTFHLARLGWRGIERTVRPVASTGSGDVLALARADAFAVTGAGGARLAPGDAVRVVPWRE